MSKNIK